MPKAPRAAGSYTIWWSTTLWGRGKRRCGHFCARYQYVSGSPSPRTATFTQSGDGVSSEGVGEAFVGDEVAAPIDFAVEMSHEALSTSSTVTLETRSDNVVIPDGPDAFAGSACAVDDLALPTPDAGIADAVSDTVNGDTLNSVDTGTCGRQQRDARSIFITRTLAPGESASSAGALTGDVAVIGIVSSAIFDMSGSVPISRIESGPPQGVMPLPAGLPLRVAGLGGLAGLAARRRGRADRAA